LEWGERSNKKLQESLKNLNFQAAVRICSGILRNSA
jgi:hypothetical protein